MDIGHHDVEGEEHKHDQAEVRTILTAHGSTT
jgi:hypothetical protein